MAKQGVMTVDIVYEPLSGSTLNRLCVYLMQGIITAFPGLRNANVAMAIRDDEGTIVRTVVFGNPSEEMKKVMEYEFGPDDPDGLPEVASA